ncbi:vacuolar protein sorting 20 [Dermatophagoides pteronyssinus]|uniref:Charged multivesicular body protein 6-like isoform X2 n=2 Tax=Dermatophagoides pteronyssinus TaxID=6956 RepID=A0A6P6XUK4_DERPT|nr:charged multivesicular body protein 6-like isoform X2 [Dermatophagoides pteronyssinus]KAH9424881.1 Charged multivesicular body protein 6 [Dermatophagoides pteronyssinus]
MGNLFGRSKARAAREAKVSATDRAILQIKQQRDKVKKYQKRLTAQIDNEVEIIRKLVQQGQKQKALLLLKKKKYTEKVLEKTDNELMTIENLIMDIEYKNVEQNVLKGIEVGNEALKKLNAVFSIEKIEALLEETEEGIQKQQEINELITGIRVGNELSDENDDELNEELNNILGEQEIQRELPEVPTEELPEIEKPEKIKATKEKRERLLVEAQ